MPPEAAPLTDDAPPPAPPEDPSRRVALIAAAVLVPVVVALVVLVNVLGGEPADDDGRGPAAVDGSTPAQREDLPVLPVEVPPATPEADASCPAFMGALPLELAGEPSRRVDSDTPYAYAWGDPAIVLICGVERPASFVTGVSPMQINGVQWNVDTSDPDATVWTTVDRPVYVEITLPPEMDSAPVTALTPEIAAALPYREPDPGD